MKDYYSILKISRSASSIEVKAAYRNLSKKFHPDVNHASNASSIFIEIKEAYEVLIDEERRSHYDQLLHYASQKQNPKVNITPTIASFYCDNAAFSIGDVVTFTWEVFDADIVELRPFGKVANSGTKKIRITDVSTNLLVELFCYNSVSKNYVFSQIILKKRDVVYQNVSTTQNTSFESIDSESFSNTSEIDKSPKIKIFNFKINRPDFLDLFIWFIAILNLFVYFSYPYFFVKETEYQAIRAFSNTENGLMYYFIEFEDFTLNVSQAMAENLQSMDQRVVTLGVSNQTDALVYYQIETNQGSIKQKVSDYDNVGDLVGFYLIFLIFQFYMSFIRNRKYPDDKFGFILGFFFVFSLAMGYILYSSLF